MTPTSQYFFTTTLRLKIPAAVSFLIFFLVTTLGILTPHSVFSQISEEDELDFILQTDKATTSPNAISIYTNAFMLTNLKPTLGLSVQLKSKHEFFALAGTAWGIPFYDKLFTMRDFLDGLEMKTHTFAELGYAYYLNHLNTDYVYTGIYGEASLKYQYEEFESRINPTTSHTYFGVKLGGGMAFPIIRKSYLKAGASVDILSKVDGTTVGSRNSVVIPRLVINYIYRFN